MLLPFLILFSVVPQSANAPPTHEPPREIVVAEITAYSSSVDETDDTPHVNAQGTRPEKGSLACPRYYDLGTEFVIEGRRYTCDDRMSMKYPDRFDIWVESKEEAIEWGVRKLPVEVVR